jgi:hypothetical protein
VKIKILDVAQDDLIQGFRFYEGRDAGLGAYFLDCLFSDIDSLLLHGGIHPVVYGHHRCLSKRFPFAIYYSVKKNTVHVHAVLDPLWIRKRLKGEG